MTFYQILVIEWLILDKYFSRIIINFSSFFPLYFIPLYRNCFLLSTFLFISLNKTRFCILFSLQIMYLRISIFSKISAKQQHLCVYFCIWYFILFFNYTLSYLCEKSYFFPIKRSKFFNLLRFLLYLFFRYYCNSYNFFNFRNICQVNVGNFYILPTFIVH